MRSSSGFPAVFAWAPLAALLALVLWSLPGYAVESADSQLDATTESGREADSAETDAEEEKKGEQPHESLLDRHKRYVDTQVQRASTWVDAFFQDPNYEAEEAYSQIRIRPELYYREEQGAEGRFRFRARFNLPNLGRRVSLVAGADEEDGNYDSSVDDSRDDGAIGLQFFLKESERWNTSFTAGIKFNEFATFFGPRVRYQRAVGERGSYRFTQTVRWQTNNAWQFNTRLDLNRVINNFWFFRQTFYGRWRGEKAEEEGYRTQVSSFLTQRLSPESGLQYEFSTVFHTRPDWHVDKYVASVRYRKRTSRDWLYYEIVPQVSFDYDYDYQFNPGIRLRLEIFYGGKGAKRFWARESEDTENFRW